MHKVLYLLYKNGPFQLSTRPIPTIPENHVLVLLRASALNPVDWKIQKFGHFLTEYPAVLGMDGAGVVEGIGEGVSGVDKGDRVLLPGSWVADHATFQQYVIVPAEITAKIPSTLSFDEAASIPLCLGTAGFALYGPKSPHGAGLFAPWLEGGRGRYAGQPIFIFGGSTSVGQFAIQLAHLSGFSPIITTASPHNTTFLKSLGASHVIDRHLPLSSLPSQIRTILNGSDSDEDPKFQVVYDAVSYNDTQAAGWELLGSEGTLVTVLAPAVGGGEEGKRVVQAFGNAHDSGQRSTARGLYRALSELLEKGDIKPNRVEVLPGGLNGIVGGLKRLERDEVSGQKLVVRPDETE